MFEKIGNIRNGAILATTLAIASCSAVGNEAEKVELNEAQSQEIMEDARLGRFGLEAYLRVLQSQPGVENLGSVTEFESSNLSVFNDQSVPLGSFISFGEEFYADDASYAAHHTTITVYSEDTGTYIQYEKESENMVYVGFESALFQNSDESFFGSDEEASPEEITAFYTDPDTEALNIEYNNDDILLGTKDYKLELKDGKIVVDMKIKDENGDKVDLGITDENAVEVLRQKFF